MQDISKTDKPMLKKWKRAFVIFLIVGIIISVANMFSMCASKDYAKRTYVAEGFALASKAKVASVEFYEQEKYFPKDNQEAGLAEVTAITGQSVKGVEVLPQGKLKIIYNNKLADNAFIVLEAVLNDQKETTWRCHETYRLEMKMLPTNCRAQIKHAKQQ